LWKTETLSSDVTLNLIQWTAQGIVDTVVLSESAVPTSPNQWVRFEFLFPAPIGTYSDFGIAIQYDGPNNALMWHYGNTYGQVYEGTLSNWTLQQDRHHAFRVYGDCGFLPEGGWDCSYTVDANPSRCVDLMVELREIDGYPDDWLDIRLNDCLIGTLGYYDVYVATTVSLGPGEYQIDFVYMGADGPPGGTFQYRLTELGYTGTSTYDCLPDVLCPPPEVEPPVAPKPSGDVVGGDVYPVSKANILLPWFVGFGGLLFAGLFFLRNRIRS
jgi:hypothetical protein